MSEENNPWNRAEKLMHRILHLAGEDGIEFNNDLVVAFGMLWFIGLDTHFSKESHAQMNQLVQRSVQVLGALVAAKVMAMGGPEARKAVIEALGPEEDVKSLDDVDRIVGRLKEVARGAGK